MERPVDSSGGTLYSIRAVQRVCDILDLIQENPDGFSLTQVAERAAFPKSSAFRYLATLEERRYVQRDPVTNTFRIGSAFLPLQSQQLSVLADRARPYLHRLRDRFGETINLGLLDGNRISYVEIVESPRAVRLAARPGAREGMHSSALGKAIASTLEIERVEAILAAEGMPRLTPSTITELAPYVAELHTIRKRGYAVDDRESEEEGRSVAVPLIGINLPAAVSLAAPASRFSAEDVQPVADALKSVAALLITDLTGTSS